MLRVFEDSGRSGLRLEGREALQALMGEVKSGRADFKAILVYEVSRWGRFQDADESAYYEYICKRPSGIRRGPGPNKRGDRGRRRMLGRIERGGGNGGKPGRSPPGWLRFRRPHADDAHDVMDERAGQSAARPKLIISYPPPIILDLEKADLSLHGS